MSYQTNLKSSGFRDLDPQELNSVSGGNLTIYLPRPSSGSGNIWSGSGDGAGGLGSGLSSFQLMDLSALASLGTVDWEKFAEDLAKFGEGLIDSDGDGEIDEVVVTDDRPDGLNVLPISFDLADVNAPSNPGPVWHEPTGSCNFLRGAESFGNGAILAGTVVGGVALIEPTPGGEVLAGGLFVVGGVTVGASWGFQYLIGCE